jgi:hypothetical protein
MPLRIAAKQKKKNSHKEHIGHKKFISLSVFIGVYRWLKDFSNHRCTPMNSDKSLKDDPGKGLVLWPVSCAVEVVP